MGCAQPAHSVLVNSALPGEEFLDREFIALARFLEAQQAEAHGADDDRLASGHPALGVGRRQFENRTWGFVARDPTLLSMLRRLGIDLKGGLSRGDRRRQKWVALGCFGVRATL